MKKCRRCQVFKPLTQFYKSGTNANGLPKYKSRCKPCHLNSIDEKRKHVQELITETLGYYSCKICGYSKSSRALHLHHLDAETKEYQISNMWSQSDSAIKKEISKCIILCANCHAEVHDGIIELET